jgi:hypothetical protein
VNEDIGGRLRGAREQRDLSLSGLATRTKLPVHVLQAIERNDFASLPGGMFRKAYVRTVAAEVGLNPDEIASDYSSRFEPSVDPPAIPDRNAARQAEWIEQLTPSPRPSIPTLVTLAVAAAVWFMLRSDPGQPNVPIDDVAGDSVMASMLQPAMIADSDDRQRDSVAPHPSGALTPDVPLRIEMAATDWCWIAAEADGERVLYRLVEPGEQLVLEGQHLISLRLGDAGAVRLSINDGGSRSFGRDGEVVDLEVTPHTVDDLNLRAVETLTDACASGCAPY